VGEADDEEVSDWLDTPCGGVVDQKDSDEEILRIRKRIHELVNIMQTYILRLTKVEDATDILKLIVFGGIAMVLTAVLGAVLYLVIK